MREGGSEWEWVREKSNRVDDRDLEFRKAVYVFWWNFLSILIKTGDHNVVRLQIADYRAHMLCVSILILDYSLFTCKSTISGFTHKLIMPSSHQSFAPLMTSMEICQKCKMWVCLPSCVHVYACTCTCMCLCASTCVCVCACEQEREKEEGRDGGMNNRRQDDTHRS